MASFPCSVLSSAGIASPTAIHSLHAPHHSSQLRSSPPVSCPDGAIRRPSPAFPAAGAIQLTAGRKKPKPKKLPTKRSRASTKFFSAGRLAAACED